MTTVPKPTAEDGNIHQPNSDEKDNSDKNLNDFRSARRDNFRSDLRAWVASYEYDPTSGSPQLAKTTNSVKTIMNASP